MKRTLAPEALYPAGSRFHDQADESTCNIPAMERVGRKRIEQIDPNFDRALALLREIEDQKE